MATFKAIVTYTFDTEYEFEADSYEQADNIASDLSAEWLPYSSEKGYTDFWANTDLEVSYQTGDLDEDEEDE